MKPRLTILTVGIALLAGAAASAQTMPPSGSGASPQAGPVESAREPHEAGIGDERVDQGYGSGATSGMTGGRYGASPPDTGATGGQAGPIESARERDESGLGDQRVNQGLPSSAYSGSSTVGPSGGARPGAGPIEGQREMIEDGRAGPMGAGGSGSTGGIAPQTRLGTDAPVVGGVIARIDDIPDLESRMGPGQNRLALLQTTMLNAFSSLGFESARDFRKDGERYYAEAMTSGGGWRTVEIDPATGVIRYAR